MDSPKDTVSGKYHDNKDYKEKEKTNIFSFKALQIDDSKNPKECSAVNYKNQNLKQTGANEGNYKPQENMNERRKILDSSKGLREIFQNKECETESTLKGNWSLYCNPNLECNGHSEANEILKSAQELYKTRPDLFLIPPYSREKKNGTIVVFFYTADYTDKELNLRVARAIREEIHYPYVMYYHKRIGNLTSFYMHTPDDEFYVNSEGTWILQE